MHFIFPQEREREARRGQAAREKHVAECRQRCDEAEQVLAEKKEAALQADVSVEQAVVEFQSVERWVSDMRTSGGMLCSGNHMGSSLLFGLLGS